MFLIISAAIKFNNIYINTRFPSTFSLLRFLIHWKPFIIRNGISTLLCIIYLSISFTIKNVFDVW